MLTVVLDVSVNFRQVVGLWYFFRVPRAIIMVTTATTRRRVQKVAVFVFLQRKLSSMVHRGKTFTSALLLTACFKLFSQPYETEAEDNPKIFPILNMLYRLVQ